MTLSRRPARLTAWIAIFAVLLAALAPGIARALASPQQAMPWSEICTASGMQQGPRDALPASESGQPSHPEGSGLKHCSFCLNHAGHFVLPTKTVECLRVVHRGTGFSPASSTPSVPRLIRVAAQPRAPPVIS